jgi:hypothetical protein
MNTCWVNCTNSTYPRAFILSSTPSDSSPQFGAAFSKSSAHLSLSFPPFLGVRRNLRQVGAAKKCAEISRPQIAETLTKSLGAVFGFFGAPQKLRFFKATQKSAVF